jgi:hypothetical protein
MTKTTRAAMLRAERFTIQFSSVQGEKYPLTLPRKGITEKMPRRARAGWENPRRDGITNERDAKAVARRATYRA